MFRVEILNVILQFSLLTRNKKPRAKLEKANQRELVRNSNNHGATFGDKTGQEIPESIQVRLVVKNITHYYCIETQGSLLKDLNIPA